MKSTFSVIYYLKRQVVKKDGTVPVMGRITVDGSQTQFSCKLTIDPKLWDTKGGRLDRKTSKEKSVKKTSPTEKNIAGSVKPGKPSARKYVFICLAKRVWSDG